MARGIFQQLDWLTKTVKKLCCIVENGGGNTGSNKGFFGVTFDGQGTVITADVVNGAKSYFRMPRSGTITGWSIVGITNGLNPPVPTCTVDVWKIADGTALPTTSIITPGNEPVITTVNATSSTTLTGWTTAFSANDIFAINIDACTGYVYINFVLTVSYTD